MFLEDAGFLTKRRRLIFPVIDLANRNLERILGEGRLTRKGQRQEQPERRGQPFEILHAISSLKPFLSFELSAPTARRIQHRAGLARKGQKKSPPLALASLPRSGQRFRFAGAAAHPQYPIVPGAR